MIFGIIIGVCVMSLSAFFAVWALDEGKEELMYFLCGPVMWIWILICIIGGRIYKKLSLNHFRKNYLRFLACGPSYSTNIYYIHKKVASDFFKHRELNSHYMDFQGTCLDAKSVPYKQFKITPNGLGREYRAQEKNLLRYIKPDSNFYRKILKRT